MNGNTTGALSSTTTAGWHPPNTPNGVVTEYTVAVTPLSTNVTQNTTVNVTAAGAKANSTQLSNLPGCSWVTVQAAAKTVAYGPWSNTSSFLSGPYNIAVPTPTVSPSTHSFNITFPSSKSASDSACAVTYVASVYNNSNCNTSHWSAYGSRLRVRDFSVPSQHLSM